ncbi:hypothetical protein [Parasphingorhabdus sp.]|uniref:hypothetical protein n=1 Tax=Parasphingorhabdus sp. TaxID=2709688 RepID=UPI003A920648
MGQLNRRISRLEMQKPVGLSPALKQWLGQPLSDHEIATLDDSAGIDADFDDMDLSGTSPEFRAWISQ